MLIVIVSCNAFATILYGAGIQGPTVQPSMNSTQFITAVDVNQTLTQYDYSTPYSDFPFAVITFVNTIWNLIFWGFPNLLFGLGAPAFITYPLVGVYTLIWFIVIIVNWIGGREA